MNHIVPNTQERRETDLSLVIDGCAVSITSSPKGTDEPLTTVREILLSAYRTKSSKCPKTQGFFDTGVQK